MEGGAIPAEILRAVHVPPYKPAVILGDTGTAGLKADMIAMRDMLVSQKAAATFLLACHDRTVKLLAEITNVDTVSAGFKTKLGDIVKPLLAGSQFPATIYDVYIAAVATALKDELCSIKLDVLAKAMRQKKEQVHKLAAATSANTDAEMADGTKSIGELVKEQFKVEMQKYQEANGPGGGTVASSSKVHTQGPKNLPKKTSTSTTQSNAAPPSHKRGGGGNARGNRGMNRGNRGRGQ
ncbi:hypothetical protein B0H14DRAFT_3549283 [Mycena olivaceomarginata]|nr:hypothetical protein B0H14DRAFT_3549283 [Mycena olivaceomarginata]